MTLESLTWLAISDTPCRVSWHKSILRFSQVLNPSGCSKSFFKRTFQHSTGLQKCISKSEGEKRWVIQETFFSSVLTFFSPEFYFGSRKLVETSFHFVGVKFQKKNHEDISKKSFEFVSLFSLPLHFKIWSGESKVVSILVSGTATSTLSRRASASVSTTWAEVDLRFWRASKVDASYVRSSP